MNLWRVCLLFAMGGLVLHAQLPERRVAVVIGNRDYHKIGTVNNAAPDAVQIAATLGQLGFALIPPSNPTYAEPDASRAYINLGLQDMHL
ncbi:MAG: caspase family protein, partial [Verrucomicrobiaceae bacterium]|nr:caspase family protein [Verrucomicrobiaceae bacterium]